MPVVTSANAELDVDVLSNVHGTADVSSVGGLAGDCQGGHGDGYDREFACEVHECPFLAVE